MIFLSLEQVERDGLSVSVDYYNKSMALILFFRDIRSWKVHMYCTCLVYSSVMLTNQIRAESLFGVVSIDPLGTNECRIIFHPCCRHFWCLDSTAKGVKLQHSTRAMHYFFKIETSISFSELSFYLPAAFLNALGLKKRSTYNEMLIRFTRISKFFCNKGIVVLTWSLIRYALLVWGKNTNLNFLIIISDVTGPLIMCCGAADVCCQ